MSADRLEGGMPKAIAILMLSVGTDHRGQPMPKVRTLATLLGGMERLHIDHRISCGLMDTMTAAELDEWLGDGVDGEGQVRR